MHTLALIPCLSLAAANQLVMIVLQKFCSSVVITKNGGGLKVDVDWMPSQQSVGRLIEEKGSMLRIQNKSMWKEVKKMSATNMLCLIFIL